MDVSIYFKSAKDWRHYTIDEAEFKRLETDYSAFLQGKSTKGGPYTMASAVPYTNATPRVILLDFSDISFG